MELSKGELYFREKLSCLGNATQVNCLVLDWAESAMIDNSLFNLSEAFMPFAEQVMDVIWLLSQDSCSDALAAFLVHFISSGNVADLSKLAIERQEPELLEKAGVITQAAALVKKTGRINTQLNYKYHKNMFVEGDELEMIGGELEKAVEEKDRGRFFYVIGKWELDLHRVLDVLLLKTGVNGVEFLLDKVSLPLEKLKEFLKIRFALLWHHSHSKLEDVISTCQWALYLMHKNLLTWDELEGITWPRNVEASRKELEAWERCLKSGSVVGDIAPFYEPFEEYQKLWKSKIKNQRLALLLVLESEESSLLKSKLIREEPFLECFLACEPKDLMQQISLSGPMPWLHDELWKSISGLPVEERYIVYDRWESMSEPLFQYSRALSLMSVKRFLRRLSKENVRQYCRLLGKVSHANPVTVLKALVEQVMVYDNLTAPVIESLRYLTVLEFDVLSFAVIRVLERALKNRRGLKEDTSMLAPWLVNLAGFVSCLFRRYGNGLGELGQVLKRIRELMVEREDGFLLTVFVSELLREMAGVASPADTNDRILVARAYGGVQLLKFLELDIVGEEELQRSSKRLFSALRNSGLLFELYYGIAMVRNILLSPPEDNINNSKEWYHVKVVGEFADRAAWTMLQYAEFLGLHKHRIANDSYPVDDEENEYVKYLKRRLLTTENSSFSSCVIQVYEQEIEKLAVSGNANDKLKKRLLEEELQGVIAQCIISGSGSVKRALVSVPDAWAMACEFSASAVVDVSSLGLAIVPYLTPFEAHNYGKFLNNLLQKLTADSTGVDSVSSLLGKSMAIEDDKLQCELNADIDFEIKREEVVVDNMEDGEMKVLRPQKSLKESIFTELLQLISNNISTNEDEVYAARRNFMIILWHLKECVDINLEGWEALQRAVEEIREAENREDLRVMASRVITIFPIATTASPPPPNTSTLPVEAKKRKLSEVEEKQDEKKSKTSSSFTSKLPISSSSRRESNYTTSRTREHESSSYSSSRRYNEDSHYSSGKSHRDYYSRR